MERLELKLQDTHKALTSLKEILQEPYTIYIRDATIKRFEYTFEAFWKFLKEYLKVMKGTIVNFPKDCFREILLLGISTEEDIARLLEMTDSRNETTHTYKQEVANKIFVKIKGYAELMENILLKIPE